MDSTVVAALYNTSPLDISLLRARCSSHVCRSCTKRASLLAREQRGGGEKRRKATRRRKAGTRGMGGRGRRGRRRTGERAGRARDLNICALIDGIRVQELGHVAGIELRHKLAYGYVHRRLFRCMCVCAPTLSRIPRRAPHNRSTETRRQPRQRKGTPALAYTIAYCPCAPRLLSRQ